MTKDQDTNTLQKQLKNNEQTIKTLRNMLIRLENRNIEIRKILRGGNES